MGQENWVGRVTPDWLQELVNAPIPGAAAVRDWVDPPNTSVITGDPWLEQVARDLYRASIPQTARDAALEGAIGMVAGPVLGAGGRAIKRYLDVAPDVSRRAFFGDTVGGGDLQRRKQLQDAMFGTPDPPWMREAVDMPTTTAQGEAVMLSNKTPNTTGGNPWALSDDAQRAQDHGDRWELLDPDHPLTWDQYPNPEDFPELLAENRRRALGNMQEERVFQAREAAEAVGQEAHTNMGVLGKQIRDWDTQLEGAELSTAQRKEVHDQLNRALDRGLEIAQTLPKHTKNPILRLGEEGFNVFSERIMDEVMEEGIEAIEDEGGETAKIILDSLLDRFNVKRRPR